MVKLRAQLIVGRATVKVITEFLIFDGEINLIVPNSKTVCTIFYTYWPCVCVCVCVCVYLQVVEAMYTCAAKTNRVSLEFCV